LSDRLPETMRAVLTTGHGGYERLEYRDDVPVPQPGAADVLIAVGAASVNATDINTRLGWYSQGEHDSGNCVPAHSRNRRMRLRRRRGLQRRPGPSR
jgi:D-arabinose 1-dehydrogenase-like Zn-dependent alcohol dehydrogenase